MGFLLRITRFMLLGHDATLEVSVPIGDMIYSCMILDNLLEQVKNILCQLAFSFVTYKIGLLVEMSGTPILSKIARKNCARSLLV